MTHYTREHFQTQYWIVSSRAFIFRFESVAHDKMEITEAQYERIKDALPVQRGNVRLSNLQVLNAVLYVAEQGCKWRGLPKRFGRWHTIYTRMNRWSKNGVLDQVFEKLQSQQIVRIKIEAFALVPYYPQNRVRVPFHRAEAPQGGYRHRT